MRLLALFIMELSKLVGSLLEIYTYVILISVLLSWVNPDPNNPIVRFLRQITEPVFYQCRKILPATVLRMGIDFSPIIALVGIMLIRNVILRALFEWGAQLRLSI